MADTRTAWPELPFAALKPTLDTLQLWTQVVGKVRLVKTPWLNHSWHVPLYVSARGLTTSLIPHDGMGFDLEFDLVGHALLVRVTGGGEQRIELGAATVAQFYRDMLDALSSLGVPAEINETPNELPDPVPFSRDTRPCVYDRDAAHRFWLALVQCDRVFKLFRTRFLGKCSPVHFFWGSFDLAVTRFSGRPAPLHPGGVPHLPDAVVREAYSHEVSSAGFWPGGGEIEHAAFYSYAYPAPRGFAEARVAPDRAYFNPSLGEFLLPYELVRTASDPDAVLLSFLQSTYEAAADLGRWDRAALECEEGRPGRPRRLG
jgi:hypothetical protein